MISKIISILVCITIFITSFFGIDFNKFYDFFLQEELNISYGEDKQQTFDVYIPKTCDKETSLYFYIHGGAWIAGDKSEGTVLAKTNALKYNIIGVTMDYRLLVEGSHKTTCQTILDDINNAMIKTKAFLEEKGYTIKSAVVSGQSAGGHLALLYSYTCNTKCPFKIGLVESVCGISDLQDPLFFGGIEAISKDEMYMLDGLLIGEDVTDANYSSKDIQDKIWDVSPCKYVSNDVPPTIFNSGSLDQLVPNTNGQRLNDKLNETTVDHFYINFDHSKHCRRDKKDFFKATKYDIEYDKMMEKYVL